MSSHVQSGMAMKGRDPQTGFHAARYSDGEMAAIAERQGLRMPRSIAQLHGVASAARVDQNVRLLTRSLVLGDPMLVAVQKGYKIISTPSGCLEVHAGEAVLIEAGEAIDVENVPDGDGLYQAHWIAFDNRLLAALDAREGGAREGGGDRRTVASPVNAPNSEVQEVFLDSVERACEAILKECVAPAAVGRPRVMELLAWVEELCGFLPRPARSSTTGRVRELLTEDLAARWTTDQLARRLGLSEATFRRRLAQEGTSLSVLLTEMRMGQALRLLQSTDLPIIQVAFSVGYESPSKFAGRFRSRFGFPPSSLRLAAPSAVPAM
ncbi:AraC family transcriptional regulator [Azospirillum brasilense]|uniref:AraC family transcriptional regulator n=1 Tax=Azospirillum brasilense TaxID=192 RepID=A0A560BB98_AZOBR|nr:helix-turn-helix domain-containing protein [Azospirillum brasilense]TWA69874.1 AraC family transcriptional regulator [Azospirillum brasilense]